METAIMRDGLPVAIVTGESGALEWFHREHSYSMSHALEHEGYALETRPDMVEGWKTFRTLSTRSGYGVAGSLARLAVALQGTVSAYAADTAHYRDAYPGPGEFDAYAAAHLAPMLDGFVGLLSHTGHDAPVSFERIRGALDAWARAAAARMGVEL